MADASTDRQRWLSDNLDRQAAVVDHLVEQARGATDAVGACLHWLGVDRQAGRYLRALQARRDAAGLATAHRGRLQAAGAGARAHLEAAPAEFVAAARAQLGLRVALVGKGGTGKSLVSGTLARLLARRGRRVLAADLDANPGLAYSLGVPPGQGALPAEALEEHPGAVYGWRLRAGLPPGRAVDRYAVEGPDGVRFLSLGKIGDEERKASRNSIMAMREIVAGFGEPSWDVVGDLEAGPTTPFERYHGFADRVLVVVTPTWVSAMTARRLLPMVADTDPVVLGNQYRGEPDHPGLTPIARIPWDPEAADAERRGLSPLDACPHSPTVAAIARLADTLTHQEVTV